ncbi:MAG: phytanoyl-CoA dioxygenase family protein [Planctomycetota bacterium]|nr:phytanoyl-CoA dioxygenase family protein [Planctomycetota bacterium]
MPAPTLNQEQIDSFHLNGFVRVGPVLEESELAPLRAEYDRLFAEAIEAKRIRNLTVADGDGSVAVAAKTQMYQIVQMAERSLVYRKLLYDTRLLDLVQEIIGPNVMVFHDQALFKPARTGGPVFLGTRTTRTGNASRRRWSPAG